MQLSWFCIQLLAGITFLWNQVLDAEQVFHPAFILKRQPGNSFNSEIAYISFTGCETNNKSLFDELPAMMRHLSYLSHQVSELKSQLSASENQIEDLTKDKMDLIKLIQDERNMLNCLQVSWSTTQPGVIEIAQFCGKRVN